MSDGLVQGTDAHSDHRNELMQAAVDLTEPPVRVRSRMLACQNQYGEADRLLVLEVEASEGVHASQRDEVFLSIGDENRKLTYRQRQELTFDKGQAVFDGSRLNGAEIDELSDERLSRYAELLGDFDPKKLLRDRGLLDRTGSVTIAAYLLFGFAPTTAAPPSVCPRPPVSTALTAARAGVSSCSTTSEAKADPHGDRPGAGGDPGRTTATSGIGIRSVPRNAARSRGCVDRGRRQRGRASFVQSGRRSHPRGCVRRSDRVESPGRFPGLVDPVDPRHIEPFRSQSQDRSRVRRYAIRSGAR